MSTHDDETSPHADAAAREVLEGLRQPQPTLSPKWFYDQAGSALFDAITELDEYYLTRTELAIMRESVGEMASALGPDAALIEFGSGSSSKTRWLLEALETPAAYVPLDISERHLLESAERLQEVFPSLEVLPVVADYDHPVSLPSPSRPASRRALFFSGSTIGNFEPDAALAFLKRAHAMVGAGGGLLIAVDLAKDAAVLNAAYDDRDGVTARFNLNALRHLNATFDAGFDIDAWKHQARYVPERGRVEMHLVCTRAQQVTLAGVTLTFEPGQTIHSESSHKWEPAAFDALLGDAGFDVQQSWTDEKGWFRVVYAVAGAASDGAPQAR